MISSLFAAAALFTWGLTSWSFLRRRELRKRLRAVRGFVTYAQQVEDGTFIRYSFYGDAGEEGAGSATILGTAREGDDIELWFDPENPYNAFTRSGWYRQPRLLAGAGAVFALLSFVTKHQ